MEESVAIIVFFKVAVPSLGSVSVGKMPGRGLESFVRRKGTTRDEAAPLGRGMGMYGGPISGNSQGVRRDESAPDGRKDSDKIKKTLEKALKVKRDVFVLQNAGGKDTVVSEAKDPLCKGSGDKAFGKKKEEQDERADDLRLVKSGASGVGIKRL